MPCQTATNMEPGDGRSTRSTTSTQKASCQTRSSATTPISGVSGPNLSIQVSHASRTVFWKTSRQWAFTRTNSPSEMVAAVRGPRDADGHVVRDLGRPARQQHHVVGEIDRLLQIVGDEHHRRPRVHEQRLQLIAHEQRHLVVERRKRLVEEQHLGLDHQRAHYRDELLLAARQLVRILGEVQGDAETVDQAFDARISFRARDVPEFQGVTDIVDRPQPREQGFPVVLEHVTEVGVAQALAAEPDGALVGLQQPRDQVDEGRFPATVRAEHRHETAARDVEVEGVVDGRLAEGLGQAPDRDMRLPRRRRRRRRRARVNGFSGRAFSHPLHLADSPQGSARRPSCIWSRRSCRKSPCYRPRSR